MNISFQKLFFAIATIFALFAILILAKSILIPLGFALLISFILYPVVKKVESCGIKTILAAFLSIFALILIIGGGIFLFSTQIFELSKEFPHFQDKIILAFTEVTLYINKNVNIIPNLEKSELFDRIKDLLNESIGSLVKQTFSNTVSFLAGLLATIIFTFLILINRKGLTKAFSWFSPEDKRERVVKMFKSVQQVGQKYFFGMILIILILGVVNSVGLWIIGIDNPFLFGFLAAILALIPYAGTFLGATIPILYSFISYESIWMPISIAIFFWFVQFIEGNFLTPKIVGGNININPLTAILSLIVGAVVWGIAGMILFLPFAAMLKIVCEEYEELKPIALLIGNQNYKENDGGTKFINKWADKIKDLFAKFHILSKKAKSKSTNK
jgi:predicted PurR-regulated permease PerM